jgi:CO/xanthine dehydrogenase Mo-binding subunit
MPDQKLVGQNYTPPDLVAKVTGRAKYAEDYRADGMLFAKLLLSPMPHCRVKSVDARAALAMPGVKAMLRADDLPDLRGAERALTDEPFYQGEPILALAAVDEATAAEAIERIAIDLEPLPFVVDPIESLRPTGANARLQGNVWVTPPPAPPGAGRGEGAGRGGRGPSTGSGAGGAGAAEPPEGGDAEVDRLGFCQRAGRRPADGQGAG